MGTDNGKLGELAALLLPGVQRILTKYEDLLDVSIELVQHASAAAKTLSTRALSALEKEEARLEARAANDKVAERLRARELVLREKRIEKREQALVVGEPDRQYCYDEGVDD